MERYAEITLGDLAPQSRLKVLKALELREDEVNPDEVIAAVSRDDVLYGFYSDRVVEEYYDEEEEEEVEEEEEEEK